MKATLGLDIGTTSVKAVVVAETGEVLSESTSGTLSMRSPHAGWAVQATSELRDSVIEALQLATASVPTEVNIVSMAAAVQSGSVATVTRSGKVSQDLATWMDTRSEPLVTQWRINGTANLIREISGWTLEAGQGLPQLGWTKATSDASWSTLGRVASANDLAVNWLTGQWVTNPSNAAGMALMDVRSGEWSQELCGLIDLSINQLSELRPSGSVIGPLMSDIAQDVGLATDVAVVNGGHDQACAALALGVTGPTRALLAGGTAWVLTNVIPPEEVAEVPAEMNVSFHVVPQLRTASKYLGGMGSNMEWWLATSGPRVNTKNRFADLDAELVRTSTTETSPYFHPSHQSVQDSQLPGAGTFSNVARATTRADRARSIMEYAAFVIRTTLLRLPESRRPTELTVVGGVTRSVGWSQLIADICEIPVTEATNHSLPALGAAVLSGVATGLYPSNETATAALTITDKRYSPNPQNADLYRRRYDFHRQQETQK